MAAYNLDGYSINFLISNILAQMNEDRQGRNLRPWYHDPDAYPGLTELYAADPKVRPDIPLETVRPISFSENAISQITRHLIRAVRERQEAMLEPLDGDEEFLRSICGHNDRYLSLMCIVFGIDIPDDLKVLAASHGGAVHGVGLENRELPTLARAI